MKHLRLTRHILLGGAVIVLAAAGSSAVALAADELPWSNVDQGRLSPDPPMILAW